jgi:hypothetical protein
MQGSATGGLSSSRTWATDTLSAVPLQLAVIRVAGMPRTAIAVRLGLIAAVPFCPMKEAPFIGET